MTPFIKVGFAAMTDRLYPFNQTEWTFVSPYWRIDCWNERLSLPSMHENVMSTCLETICCTSAVGLPPMLKFRSWKPTWTPNLDIPLTTAWQGSFEGAKLY